MTFVAVRVITHTWWWSWVTCHDSDNASQYVTVTRRFLACT